MRLLETGDWRLEPRQHEDFVAGQAVGPYWHTDGLDSSLFQNPVVAHAGTASAIIKTEGETTVGWGAMYWTLPAVPEGVSMVSTSVRRRKLSDLVFKNS